ncbi:MAG: AI-2E family transporter [Burkholderiales bacterium]|nr:AI-2E family transporter [Burkholderiales bacterium]
MMPRENSRQWWLLAVALVVGVLLYFLGPILSPFLLAAILAYIGDPLVDKLQARRVPRTVGTVLVLILILGFFVLLLAILIPLFYREFVALSEKLPRFLSQLAAQVEPWLQRNVDPGIQLDVAGMRDFLATQLEGEQIAGNVWASLKIGGGALIGFFVNLLLVPVVFFYLLRDWDIVVAKIDGLFPRRWHARASTIARELDAVLGEFLRGQLSVVAFMAVYYVIGLRLTGLEFSLPIGIITAIMIFIPYVGSFVGLLLATLAAFMQFDSFINVIWVWVVFVIGQSLEGVVVTPWLVGDRIGLHPVAVIFALLAFGQVFGFFGVLLALPASAALLVGLRHLRQDYLKSNIYHG